jgi:2-amino-4-hydroxy-6-hydroxymethyldihydropteridine diphosphokinase
MIIIALGSNLSGVWGSPNHTLYRALDELTASGIQIEKISRLYCTRAHSYARQPNFLNAVIATETFMPADAIFQVLQRIEARGGREKAKIEAEHTSRWQARPLDLDIIDYKGVVHNWIERRPVPGRRLILPHPRAHQRAFVLQPLSDIAPTWHHPVFGLTASALLKRPLVRGTGPILSAEESWRESRHR